MILLILSTILSGVFLPYIAPTPPAPTVAKDGAEAEKGDGVWGFLSPLKVFLPRVVEKEDGGDGKRYWGLTLLGTGVFVGVLALAYVPLMLQLTATNTYNFKPTQVRLRRPPSSKSAHIPVTAERLHALDKRHHPRPLPHVRVSENHRPRPSLVHRSLRPFPSPASTDAAFGNARGGL